jgi:hypothetical protein
LVTEARHILSPPCSNLVLVGYAPDVVIARALSQNPNAVRKRRFDQKKRAGLDRYAFDLPTAKLQEAMKIRAYYKTNEFKLTYQGMRDCTSKPDFSQQEIEKAVAGLVDWWWKRWLSRRNALLR